MFPRPTIDAFDRHLAMHGLRFEGVVIGGSALGLMGVIQRPTRDFDILVPELPPEILAAARDFAKTQRQAGATFKATGSTTARSSSARFCRQGGASVCNASSMDRPSC
jgi:hypothetical protein